MTDERFWKNVEKTDSCWVWTGTRSDFGYGRLRRGWSKRALWAHRYSWELANGPIPDGMKVLHRCDNPPCVNPAHLFIGTQGDNVRDMVAKGREYHQQFTHCPNGHPLAGDNLHPSTLKRGHRRCWTCTRERTTEWARAARSRQPKKPLGRRPKYTEADLEFILIARAAGGDWAAIGKRYGFSNPGSTAILLYRRLAGRFPESEHLRAQFAMASQRDKQGFMSR